MRQLFLIITLTACSVYLMAQSQQLTLQDALSKGMQHNFNIQIAYVEQDIAARNNSLLEAGILPSLNLSANRSYNVNDVDNPASFIRGKFTTIADRVAGDLTWTLFNGFAVWISKERLALLHEQSLDNGKMVVENTIQGITLAYLNAVAQQQQLGATKNSLEISFDQYQRVKQRKELGAAGSFELLQAQNAYYLDSTAYLRQQNTYFDALRSVQLLIGDSANTNVELSDLADENFPLFDKQELSNKLTENNLSLRQQMLNVALAENAIRQEKTALYPSISITSGASRSLNEIRFDEAPQQNGSGGQNNYYIQFALNFNVFNNLRVHRAIKNAKDNVAIAELTKEQLTLNLSHELDKHYQQYHARLSIKNLAEQTLENAKTQLAMAEERLRSGAIDSFDFRQIQLDYLNANAQYYLSVFQTMESYLEILRLSGSLLKEVAS